MTDGEQPWAGIVPGDTGRWVPYVVVDDLDSATRATALGGTVVRARTVGPAGTSVLVADPGGAVVALFTPSAG
jgi:predicted enzyme related to lactoylglutathione lyase